MNTEFLKIFYSITAFQLFFFGLVIITIRPTKQYLSWLAAFLIIKSLDLLLIITYWHYKIVINEHLYRILKFMFEYSLCPIFYMFVIKVSKEKFIFNLKKILFFIPFIIGFIFLNLPDHLWSRYYMIFHPLLTTNYYGQAIIYSVLSYKHYKKFQAEMGNHLDQDSIQRLNWLKLVIFGFIILWTTAFISNLIYLFYPVDYSIVNFIMEIILLLFFNVFLFLGTRLPKSINEIVIENFPLAKNNPDSKYATSGLSESAKNEILQRLNNKMEEMEIYKTPNLTLKRLSDILNFQPKHLSQIINEHYKQNFCEYINTLRIEEAKKQLANQNNNHKTILEIIYETGFNSKSVFNTVFKKQTGCTPSAYRNKEKNRFA